MNPASRQLRVPFVVLASVLLACGGGGDGGNPLVPPTAGIRAVAGANVTDTVLALQNQALIVEVRNNDGKLAQGVVVRFEAQSPADTSRRYEPAVFVCSLSTPSCGNTYGTQFTTDTTHSQGRAKALIRLGQVAGRAVVLLFVPELGLVDSVAFTVTPGSVGRVRSIAGDTDSTSARQPRCAAT